MENVVVLKKLRQVNASFPYAEPMKRWKEKGKKVVGWLCNYVPEEVIHAAGMLPVRLTADSKELEMPDGDAYLHIYSCSFTRSIFQLAREGQFDFIDGFVATAMCDGSRRLADVLNEYKILPLIYTLGVPRKFGDRAEALYRGEILNCKKKIEDFFDIKISDEAIKQSISIYNRTRQLLRRLYGLRKSSNPPISGAEILEVLNASVRMDREEFNPILEKLLQELEQRRIPSEDKIRLMIDGSILNNVEFIKGIEDLGGLVVVDGVCNGARYWEGTVEDGFEPISALAHYYLNKFPCPRFYPPGVRTDRVLDLIKAYQVEGVIYEIIRYCNTHTWDYPILKSQLDENGIPILELDLEYGTGASGRVKTRVQAFLEMLREKKEVK
jgi:bzd-type benzoyl-CoA reductase N subunit